MLTVVSVIPLLAGALFLFADRRPTPAALVLLVCVIVLGIGHALIQMPAIATPAHLRFFKHPTILSAWNAQSSIRVHTGPFFTWSLSSTYAGPRFPMVDMLIDGIGGTQIVAFDGNPASLADYEYLDYDLNALGQKLVPVTGRQLIVGPGGGVDILQAVRRGRSDITAVEINPLVAQVVNGDLGAFSGRPYHLPGVRVFVENGRTFVKRTDERWDLVSLTWVDTGGSSTALAFSENYLYTQEAYREFLGRLTDDGFFAFMRALGYQETMSVDTMRGLAVAVEALDRLGVKEPGRHLLVAASQSPYFFKRAMCYVLIKRSPFSSAEIATAREFLTAFAFQPIWLPDGSPAPSSIPAPYSLVAPTIRAIITSPDRPAVYREAAYDIWPSSDDNPFYFVQRGGPNRPAGVGAGDVRAYLFILLALVVPFIGLPLLAAMRRTDAIGVPGLASLVYFCLIGVAFMFVELEFFHVFSLVLGNPTITLATVLATLLLCSGLGSVSAGWVARTPARRLAALAALVVLLLVFVLSKESLVSALVAWPFWLRVIGTVGLMAPIAVLMGLPMPIGAHLTGARTDLMLWGWALNGAFSVVASAAAIFLAIHVGIAATFAAGTAAYALALALLPLASRRVPELHRSPEHPTTVALVPDR